MDKVFGYSDSEAGAEWEIQGDKDWTRAGDKLMRAFRYRVMTGSPFDFLCFLFGSKIYQTLYQHISHFFIFFHQIVTTHDRQWLIARSKWRDTHCWTKAAGRVRLHTYARTGETGLLRTL